jgi:hypothetical protein
MMVDFQVPFGDTASSILGGDSFAPSPCSFCESKNTVIPKEHAIQSISVGKMMILLWNVYPIFTQSHFHTFSAAKSSSSLSPCTMRLSIAESGEHQKWGHN